MQAGFTALESGLVRSKSSINVAIKNFANFLVAASLFWLFGFGLHEVVPLPSGFSILDCRPLPR